MPYDKKDFVVRLQKSTPLPPELHFSEPGIEPDSTHLDAYSLALQLAQIRAWPKTPGNASKKWPDKLPPPLASRILGYLLTEVPVKDGATRVAREITSCRKDTRMLESSVDDLYRLADLARFYSLTLIKTFKKYSGRTPNISSHPSRSSVEDERRVVEDRMLGNDEEYLQVKQEALKRDGYCCVLSHEVDATYYENLNESEIDTFEEGACETNAAHIIPHKLATNHTNAVKSMSSSTIWTILERWAGLSIDEVQGKQINRLENIITLSTPLHGLFDRMLIWFTHLEDQTYAIESARAGYLARVSENPVTLTSTDPDLPLPNPEYFRLHRACARVLHLSGAAEYIDDVIRREELSKVPCEGRVLTEEKHSDLYDVLVSLDSGGTAISSY